MKNNVVSYSKYIFKLFLLLSLLSFFFVISKGSISSLDTLAYFKMRPNSTAAYPIFLRGLHFLFKDNYLHVVIGIQFSVVISSIYVFVFYFLKHFSLKLYQLALIMILLFYPVVDANVFAINNITTEGLSYAFFLLLVYAAYLLYIKRSMKCYWLLAIITIGLISIRGQFKFLIPLFLITEMILVYKEKRFRAQTFLILFLIPVFTFLLDNGYHKVAHKQYFSTPATWVYLVSSVLFVSEESDEQWLETDEQKQLFKLIQEKFREKKIGLKDHKYYEEPIDYNYYFFQYEYPTICNQTIQRELVKYYLKEKKISSVESYLEKERICKELFFQLIPRNFSKWISLVFQGIVGGVGGVFMLLVYFTLLILLLKKYFESNNYTALFFAFLIMIILCNRVIVSISVHNLTRYFFYTDWISLLMLFLGINLISGKETK